MFQGLSNNKRRTFLGIANGKITYKPNKDAEPQQYENLDGILTGITTRDANVNNTQMKFYDLAIVDGNGEEAILSVVAEGGVARGLILALANVKDFSLPIRIHTYAGDSQGKTYTNTIVYQNGVKVPWIIEMKDLPKGLPLMDAKGRPFYSNGVQQYDYSERNEKIEEYVNLINSRCVKKSEEENPEVDFDDENDMPANL